MVTYQPPSETQSSDYINSDYQNKLSEILDDNYKSWNKSQTDYIKYQNGEITKSQVLASFRSFRAEIAWSRSKLNIARPPENWVHINDLAIAALDEEKAGADSLVNAINANSNDVEEAATHYNKANDLLDQVYEFIRQNT